jgi:hypothetical protein
LLNNDDIQVWTFPNFGKRHGFGEPDVLILVGNHSIWIEVETKIDLRSKRLAARRAVLQLARFRMFHHALQHGRKVRLEGRRHLAIMGPTLSDTGRVKFGILRESGHPVLGRSRPELIQSTPHLVLMSVEQPIGHGSDRYSRGLKKLGADVFGSVNHSLQEWAREKDYDRPLPNIRTDHPIWFTYWRGHALAACCRNRDPLSSGGWERRRP